MHKNYIVLYSFDYLSNAPQYLFIGTSKTNIIHRREILDYISAITLLIYSFTYFEIILR